MAGGRVISCQTSVALAERLQEANDSKKLIVVELTAASCRQCLGIAPFVAQFARELPSVTFLEVDGDTFKEMAGDWDVEAIPTFVFMKEGNILGKVVGAKKDELQRTIAKHITSAADDDDDVYA